MDEEEVSESQLLLEAKINAPLTWEAPPFCEILDLKEEHYEEVIRLIKHHYFKEDPMCKSSNLLQDRESKQQYLNLIKIWMNDSTSLIAISKSSGKVIGTVITRINSSLDKTNTYSRIQIFRGKALDSIMSLKSVLVIEADAYNKFNVERYLRIYILCVHPSYEKNNLSAELLFATYQLAKSLELAAIAGIFTSAKTQSIAAEVGLQILAEINYESWIIDEKIVFDDSRSGNYSAAFMGKLTPDEKAQEEILNRRKLAWEEAKNAICKKSQIQAKRTSAN